MSTRLYRDTAPFTPQADGYSHKHETLQTSCSKLLHLLHFWYISIDLFQFNDIVNVPFSSEAFVAGILAYFLDNTLHKKDGNTRKDRGKHWWDKFRSFKTDSRSEEFYSLPFNLNKYFPSVWFPVPSMEKRDFRRNLWSVGRSLSRLCHCSLTCAFCNVVIERDEIAWHLERWLRLFVCMFLLMIFVGVNLPVIYEVARCKFAAFRFSVATFCLFETPTTKLQEE